MIICFKCTPETKQILDRLLGTKQYKDYAEIISVAVTNLDALQAELVDKDAIVIEIDEEGSNYSNSQINDQKFAMSKQLPNFQKYTNQNASISANSKQPYIPSIFLLNDINAPHSFGKMPTDVWASGQEVPLDRWLFGQYNKLLPTKANCRALAHLLKVEPKGISIEKASSITKEATILGDYLKILDEQNEINRDEALSTAFPFSGENNEKSRTRYTNHFIGSVNKVGQVSGLLIDLKFINHTGGKSPRILLTEIGWNFAKFHNPILDGEGNSLLQKFSDEEIKFLLNHITRHVPAEDSAYQTILKAILDGADSPEKIDSHLQKSIKKNPKRELSNSFLSSQRSGAISRMADLKLVERERDGVRVIYKVTKDGKQYLKGNL